MRARDVNRIIERLGGQQVRQKGSHRVYRVANEHGSKQTTVSQHAGDIPLGTLRAIQQQLAPVFGEGWLI